MSKNLTRKGFAFGALVALGASVFASAPAFAADSVVLAANYTTDKTLAAPITETLTLNASLAPGSTAANIAQLKYKVVTDSTFVASVSTVSAGGSTSTAWGTTAATVYTNTSGTTGVTNGVFGASGTVKTTTYVTPNAPTAQAANTITLGVNAVADTNGTTGVSATSATATKTVVVTAFIDANLNGALDAGEVAQEQTVKFLKFSEITTDTSITAPTQGDVSVSALVKFTNVNMEALTAGRVGAYFTKGDGTALGSTFTITAATNATTTATVTAANDLLASDTVTTAGLAPSNYVGTFAVSAPSSTAFSYTITAAANTTGTGTAARTNDAAGRGNVALVTGTATYRGQTVVAYSSTLGGFKFVTGAVNALVKATAVKVQPLLSGSALGAAQNTDTTKTVGTAATASVTARNVGSLTADFVKSTTAAAANTASAAEAELVAINSEKTVAFTVKDTTSPVKKVLAGQTVTVKVETDAVLSATKTITINGTTYSSNASLPGYSTTVAKLSLTTGADGKALVTYKTAGMTAAANSKVTLTAYIENWTATAEGTETDLVYYQYIANNEGDVAVTTDGTPVVLNVVVQDQFGGAAPDGKFQINAAARSSSQVTAGTTASSTYAAVVGGKATLTITDNGTGIGTNVYGLARYTLTNGVAGTPVTIAGNNVSATASVFGTPGTDTTFTIYVKAAADVVPGEVILTGATKSTVTGVYALDAGDGRDSTHTINLNYAAHKSVDMRSIVGTEPTQLDNAGNALTTGVATITGTVNSASTATYGGVAQPSAPVTVAGAGLLFKVVSDTVGGTARNLWGDGSLSFVAANDGTFTIYVYTHLAGAQTVTITSGSGSAKVKVYGTAAAVADASSVTVKVADGASQFQAGRALDVVVSVADAFGNPIATSTAANPTDLSVGYLKLTQTGAGYLSNTGFVSTGAAGTYTTKLITNAGDLGTSSITAYLNLDNADDTYDLSTVKTAEFGVTDVDVTVGGRAIYASAEFAKGKTVTVSVDGKRLYSKLMSTDAYTELKFTQKNAGKHTVVIRVSGGVSYTETVTTTK